MPLLLPFTSSTACPLLHLNSRRHMSVFLGLSQTTLISCLWFSVLPLALSILQITISSSFNLVCLFGLLSYSKCLSLSWFVYKQTLCLASCQFCHVHISIFFPSDSNTSLQVYHHLRPASTSHLPSSHIFVLVPPGLSPALAPAPLVSNEDQP